jgi:hypothetical protein
MGLAPHFQSHSSSRIGLGGKTRASRCRFESVKNQPFKNRAFGSKWSQKGSKRARNRSKIEAFFRNESNKQILQASH